jgi:RNA polymerase sigma-70 factor, ECF subfamily
MTMARVAEPAATDRADLVASLYDRHGDELFGYLCRYCGTRDAAEDLLQETFLRLVREVRAGRTPEQARAWLYRVATNLAMSRGRRISALGRTFRRLRLADPQPSPEPGVIGREARDELLTAVSHLGSDARSALLLSAQGFSGVEIAALINRTPLATRSLLFRARTALRNQLGGEEEPS